MNNEAANQTIRLSYQCIRIVKEIQRGNRSSTSIAKKVGCTKQLANYYLQRLVYKEIRQV